MLALMELNVSLYDLFEGAIFEQQVKTKTKQKVLELIKSPDFFQILEARGIRETKKEHENLKQFLCLNAQYSYLLKIEKLAKTLDSLAQNEELMGQILGGDMEDQADPNGGGHRLGTIGEDGDEDQMQMTKGQNSKGQAKI